LIEEEKSKMGEYRVYVVELDFEAIKEDESALKQLKKKNRRLSKCERALYVGYSSHSATCRLSRHKWDPKTDLEFVCSCGLTNSPGQRRMSSALVKQFEIGLRPNLYKGLIPAYSSTDAKDLERIVARHLQKQKFAVYSDAIPNIERNTRQKLR